MDYKPHRFVEVLNHRLLRTAFAGRFFLALCLVGLLVTAVAAQSPVPQYFAKKTQVDTSQFPKIRVFASITDAKGNPIGDDQAVSVVITEDGKEVSRESLSTGYTVSSVLALDVSGSMSGLKLEEAKVAAINYIDLAQGNHQIGIVAFSSYARLIQPFTRDKDILRERIQGLTAGGDTAIQGAVSLALNQLTHLHDRKSILVLTDGIETVIKDEREREEGQKYLIRQATKQECSISAIGLGGDVDANYLQNFEQTQGGQYLFSPSAALLSEIFRQNIKSLQKERVFTYTTSNRDPDGTRRSIAVALNVNGRSFEEAATVVTIPGLLPHVVGSHTFYLLLLLVLLAAPRIILFVSSVYKTFNFRRRHMVRVTADSAYIGKTDLNDSPEQSFAAGDVLILCPRSETPHHVQCWRLNKCRCFLDNSTIQICYHRALPSWMRKGLDRAFGEHSGKTGRTWLCRCAGDQEGC
jgi:Mg-chelatase subunit ChlD